MKCLIINDEKNSWKIIQKQLSRVFDFSEYFFADNGWDGVEIAKRELPDLIILDIVMPGLDGFQTLNLLKSDILTKNIPVVIITNKVKDDDAKIQASSIGANAFLRLPLDESELVEEVKKVLSANSINFKIKEHRDYLKDADKSMPARHKFTKDESLFFDEFKDHYSESIDLNEILLKERETYKELLHALRLSEHRYRILFEQDRDLLFLTKRKGDDFIIFDVNKTALKKLNTKKEQLLNSNLCSLFTSETKNYKEKLSDLIEGKNEYWETGIVASTGENLIVEISFHELETNDEELFFASMRDITERKKMASHLRTLSLAVQNSPISVILTDKDGNIEYVNEFFTNLTGYEEEEVIGENPRILKSGVQDQEFYEQLWATITGGDVWSGRFCNKKKNGELYWEEAVITPVTDEDGVITNYVGLKVDITRHVKLLDDLKKARMEAIKAEKLKSEFLAKVSHEIRTPLNAIINLSNLLAEELVDELDEFAIQSREGIISAGKRLTRTVDLILYLSMLETGNYQVNKTQANLSQVLIKVIEEFRVEATNKGLEFEVVNELDDEEIFVCDSFAVEQIVSNLLENAIKFTEKGKVKVELRKTAENKYTVSVTDTGIGIAREKLEDVFQPFYQIEAGYTKKYEGLGVGLSVAKRFADLNGFGLEIQSEQNTGTKVTLTIQ